MHHIYLKVKSVALYALPICVLVLLSFGVSISTAEASEISSLDIVVVETSLMTVSTEQVASNTQLVDQSSWDSFWNWDWIWNW